MSHEAHHEEHHEGPEIDIKKSKPAFVASFWFVIILAGLFIAALNFVNVMSQPEEGHGGGHEATHQDAGAHSGTDKPETNQQAPQMHREVTPEGTTTETEKPEKH